VRALDRFFVREREVARFFGAPRPSVERFFAAPRPVVARPMLERFAVERFAPARVLVEPLVERFAVERFALPRFAALRCVVPRRDVVRFAPLARRGVAPLPFRATSFEKRLFAPPLTLSW
jgi:hypothetical protein